MASERSDAWELGRVERGLNAELTERPGIGPAERNALRAIARAVDIAESLRDIELLTRASKVYLECRTAAGLTAGGSARERGRPSIERDWDRWLTGLSEPESGHAEDID